jgi:hypothetical protein
MEGVMKCKHPKCEDDAVWRIQVQLFEDNGFAGIPMILTMTRCIEHAGGAIDMKIGAVPEAKGRA